MLTKGEFPVPQKVPGHTKEYTEGFTEEMVIPYRTEELNPYLPPPSQPNKQNKVYHLTNPIHHPGILHIYNTKNYEITNSTHRNDLASNPK